MAFEPGDVVMLKSGGHAMTVVSASDDEITCVWINEVGQLFREAIPLVALESVYGDEEHEEEDEEHDEEEEEEEDDEAEEDDEEDEDDKKGRNKRP